MTTTSGSAGASCFTNNCKQNSDNFKQTISGEINFHSNKNTCNLEWGKRVRNKIEKNSSHTIFVSSKVIIFKNSHSGNQRAHTSLTCIVSDCIRSRTTSRCLRGNPSFKFNVINHKCSHSYIHPFKPKKALKCDLPKIYACCVLCKMFGLIWCNGNLIENKLK